MKRITEDSFPFKYLLYFLVVAIVISIAGYLIYNDRKNAIEDELYRHVATIKEIKLAQIEKEQLQRQKAIASFLLLPEIKTDLKNLFTKRQSPALLNNVNKWTNEIKNDFEFESINIFNKNADLLYSTDSTHAIYEHFLKHELVVMLQKDSSALSNLYLGDNKKLLQAIITPINNGNEIVGYLWTEISFFEYLHPIISYTKQETEDVEYILLKKQSDLGFVLRDMKEDNEFKIKTIPISKQDKNELESFIKTKDFFNDAKFKGSKIFASVNEIPGTDWI
jgi:hypothetical protein